LAERSDDISRGNNGPIISEPPSTPGEHTGSMLAELGYDVIAIAVFRQGGIN
jgi:hypothetical protein